MKKLFVAIAMGLALAACAGCAFLTEKLGLEKPQGFPDQLAYAKGTLAGGVQSATAALNSGAITVAVDEKIQADAIKVRDGLKLAQTIYGNCLASIPATVPAPAAGAVVPNAQAAIQAAVDACGKGDALAQLRLTQALLDSLMLYLTQRGVKTQ